MNKLYGLICLCLLVMSCNKAKKATYVGAFSHVQTLAPSDLLLEITDDSLIYKTWGSEKITHVTHNDVVGHTRRNLLFLFDFKDTSKTSRNEYQSFIQTRSVDVSVESLNTALTKNKWAYTVQHPNHNLDFDIKNILSFEKGIAQWQRQYYYQEVFLYSEIEEYPFEIISYEKSTLIRFKDTVFEENLFPILQLVSLNENKIVFEHAKYGTLTQDTLIKINNESAEKNNFNGEIVNFYDNGLKSPYYGGKAKYKGGSKKVLNDWKQLNRDYPIVQDGSIIFNFDVNHQNQLGRFGLEMTDTDYKPTIFPPELIKDLFKIVREIQWEVEISDDQINSEVHAFIMFKITKGKITDVLP